MNENVFSTLTINWAQHKVVVAAKMKILTHLLENGWRVSNVISKGAVTEYDLAKQDPNVKVLYFGLSEKDLVEKAQSEMCINGWIMAINTENQFAFAKCEGFNPRRSYDELIDKRGWHPDDVAGYHLRILNGMPIIMAGTEEGQCLSTF